uniref:Uncharacterized protein n=1 Tax=Glossina pallidipes TaxID=7398 RepID=A0A1A9Z309_GLOPL
MQQHTLVLTREHVSKISFSAFLLTILCGWKASLLVPQRPQMQILLIFQLLDNPRLSLDTWRYSTISNTVHGSLSPFLRQTYMMTNVTKDNRSPYEISAKIFLEINGSEIQIPIKY